MKMSGDGRRWILNCSRLKEATRSLTARQNFRSDITSCRCPTTFNDQKFKVDLSENKTNVSFTLESLTNTVKMPRDAEPSLNERNFITQALSEGLRTDNRKLDQCRPVQLDLGDEFGVADVKFGKTR